MPRRANKGLAATTCACPRSRALSPPPDRRFEPKSPNRPLEECNASVRRKQFNINPVFPVYAGPLDPAQSRERIKRPPRGETRAGSLGQDMAGRDTGIAPRVLRPIHRSFSNQPVAGSHLIKAEAMYDHQGCNAPPTLRGSLTCRMPHAKRKIAFFNILA